MSLSGNLAMGLLRRIRLGMYRCKGALHPAETGRLMKRAQCILTSSPPYADNLSV